MNFRVFCQLLYSTWHQDSEGFRKPWEPVHSVCEDTLSQRFRYERRPKMMATWNKQSQHRFSL